MTQQKTTDELSQRKNNYDIQNILNRKEIGIDCTEEESAILKWWLRTSHKSPKENLQTFYKIHDLFPLEFSEYSAEASDFDIESIFPKQPQRKEQSEDKSPTVPLWRRLYNDMGSGDLSKGMAALDEYRELATNNLHKLAEVLELITTSPEWIKNYGGGAVDKKAKEALSNIS